MASGSPPVAGHRAPERREVDDGGDAREVLEQHASRRERDLDLGRRGRLVAGQVLHVLARDGSLAGVAEGVLEEHLDREREPPEVDAELVGGAVEPVVVDAAASSVEGVAGAEGVCCHVGEGPGVSWGVPVPTRERRRGAAHWGGAGSFCTSSRAAPLASRAGRAVVRGHRPAPVSPILRAGRLTAGGAGRYPCRCARRGAPGAIAQLVERCNRTAEVRSSTLLGSTKGHKGLWRRTGLLLGRSRHIHSNTARYGAPKRTLNS